MDVTYFTQINGRIDPEEGIIRGVSVITEGKAKGHDLHIDSKTVQSLQDASEKSGGRVKTKLNHKSGIEAVFGYLQNFRIEGPNLRADLKMLKSHRDYDQTMEQIREMPTEIGLSVAFTGEPEVIEGKKFARAKSIVSSDLVPEPAANPTGMFSAKTKIKVEEVDSNQQNKDANTMDSNEEILNRLNEISGRLDQQEQYIQGLYEQDDADDEGGDQLVSDQEIADAMEQLRAQGYDEQTIEDILVQEVENIYDGVEGEEEGEEDYYDPRQGIEDGGTDGGKEVPAMSGGYGGQDAYAGQDQGGDGGELAALRRRVYELEAAREAEVTELANQQVTEGISMLREKIDILADERNQLATKNDALLTALEIGNQEALGGPVPAKEIILGEGDFEANVQTLLSTGEAKTSSEAIQLAVKSDPVAHMEYLQRIGARPTE